MIRDFEASGRVFEGRMRDNNVMNTVVFPEPVGKETPMRDAPDLSASVQASRQDS